MSKHSLPGVTFPRPAALGERHLGAVSAYMGADGVVRLDLALPAGCGQPATALLELVRGLESCIAAMRADRGSIAVRGCVLPH